VCLCTTTAAAIQLVLMLLLVLTMGDGDGAATSELDSYFRDAARRLRGTRVWLLKVPRRKRAFLTSSSLVTHCARTARLLRCCCAS
jgi:hypothetical protein